MAAPHGASGALAILGRGWATPARLGATGHAEMAEAADDVREAIRTILATGTGERLMRPDWGAGLEALAFEPMSTTTFKLLEHRVEQALVRWEPRIDVLGVRTARGAAAQGRVDIRIDYRIRSTNVFYNLVYPFYLQEGTAR